VRIDTEVVEATQELIDKLKGRLRHEDEQECWAMAHVSADEGLQQSFESAHKCWVALWKGEPILAFGVGAGASLLRFRGTPWLLGTEKMKEVKVAFLRESRRFIAEMLEPFEMLENWVDVRNRVSILWLKWCGFTMDKPEPFGPDNRLFMRFYMYKQGVGYVS